MEKELKQIIEIIEDVDIVGLKYLLEKIISDNGDIVQVISIKDKWLVIYNAT